MNPRVVIGLVAVAVVLAAAAFFANQSGSGTGATGTTTPTPGLLLTSDKPVERVTVTDLGKRVQIHKESDKWVLDEPPAPEADQTRAASVAAELGRLRPARTL